MQLPDVFKLILFFLILTLVILLNTMEKQRWTSIPFSFQVEHNCSFDHIEVCQASGPGTNGTFLYIIWGGAGFGSELNQLLLAFTYSVASKRQFLIDSRLWNYGNLSEYFRLAPISFTSSRNYTFLVENNRENDQIEHLRTTRTGAQVGRFWRATRHVQSIESKRRAAHYFWQTMSNETQSFVQQCRLRNLSNYVGIHVRRGDKLAKEARSVPLLNYIKRIETIVPKNESQRVFVASDDPSTTDDFQKLKPQWVFISVPLTEPKRNGSYGHRQAEFNRLDRQRKRLQTHLLICQLQMLIDADYVFCTMSSNICRLIQILRHQPPATMISLDRSWYGT
jgi:hypothetical protein